MRTTSTSLTFLNCQMYSILLFFIRSLVFDELNEHAHDTNYTYFLSNIFFDKIENLRESFSNDDSRLKSIIKLLVERWRPFGPLLPTHRFCVLCLHCILKDLSTKLPMSSKSPWVGRLIAILKKIDDYIAVNKWLFRRTLYESRSFRKKLTKNRLF